MKLTKTKDNKKIYTHRVTFYLERHHFVLAAANIILHEGKRTRKDIKKKVVAMVKHGGYNSLDYDIEHYDTDIVEQADKLVTKLFVELH